MNKTVLIIVVLIIVLGGIYYFWSTSPTEAPTGTETPVSATVNVSNEGELAPYLVAANGMTLYIFDNDEPSVSNCYDGCAVNWPPLVADGDPVAGDGVSGVLGVTDRTDGTRQVTYNGMPLYFWINDSAPGDTTGHGVNNVWWVAVP